MKLREDVPVKVLSLCPSLSGQLDPHRSRTSSGSTGYRRIILLFFTAGVVTLPANRGRQRLVAAGVSGGFSPDHLLLLLPLLLLAAPFTFVQRDL